MRLPDRTWVPALAALGLAVLFVLALLVRADGDASLLVHAAPPNTDASTALGSLTVQPDVEDGFDGQFFYRLGVQPWSTAKTEGGVTFDLPALRSTRIGFGGLAWAASGGDPDLVPWSLIAVNLAAAAAVGAIGGGLARSAGRHAAWGTLFILWPGFAYSLSLDTSELVASAFGLGALLALHKRRWWPAALLLAAAALTRETTLALAIATAGVGAWRLLRPKPDAPDAKPLLAAGIGPLALFAGWQLLMRSRFGQLPLTSSGDNNLSAPLSGLVDQLGAVIIPNGSAEALRLVSIIALVTLIGAAGWLVAKSRRGPIDVERLAWVGAVAVVVVLNAYLWSGATAFMRASTEAGMLSILVLVRRAPIRLLGAAGIGLAGLWAITAVAQLTKLG